MPHGGCVKVIKGYISKWGDTVIYSYWRDLYDLPNQMIYRWYAAGESDPGPYVSYWGA